MEESNKPDAANEPNSPEIKDGTMEALAKPPQHLCKFTIDGEVLVDVMEEDGRVLHVPHPLKTAYLLPTPPWLDDKYIEQIKLLYDLICDVKKHLPNREVPITRTEFYKAGGSRKKVNKLMKGGYLRQTSLNLLDEKGKLQQAMSCIYYTPQGRALVREKIDPSYAKTENIA